jgi:hypothetical protein
MIIILVCRIFLIYRGMWLNGTRQIHSINHTNGVGRGQRWRASYEMYSCYHEPADLCPVCATKLFRSRPDERQLL